MMRSDSETAFSCDVLIPCYNYGRYLAECVQSVLRQGVRLRILVIDDASTDETPEIGRELARRYPEVEYVRHTRNIGHIRTYNEGIEWAASSFFTLLSADDLMMPGALKRASAALAAHPAMSMVHGRAIYFQDGLPLEALLDRTMPVRPSKHPCLMLHACADSSGGGVSASDFERRDALWLQVDNGTAFFRQNKAANRVHTCAVTVRTEIQKTAGGYRTALPHAGDYEMWLRLATFGPVGFIARFQGAARQHKINMSRTYDHSKDLQQRALSFSLVTTEYGRELPRDLLDEMRHSLAAEALGATSTPLKTGNHDEVSLLVNLATELDPRIRRKWPWLKYITKRTVGPEAWDLICRCVGRRHEHGHSDGMA